MKKLNWRDFSWARRPAKAPARKLPDPGGSLCTRCVSQRHTTEQHDQARSNDCSGLDVRDLTVNLGAHMAPVDCPGCNDCQPELRP